MSDSGGVELFVRTPSMERREYNKARRRSSLFRIDEKVQQELRKIDAENATYWHLLRAIDAGDDIAIIALTANDSAEDRVNCQQVGMNDFLTKPVQRDKLQDVLQRFIS